MLVKRSIGACGIVKERVDVGERISCVLGDFAQVNVIYRRPELKTATDID